MSTHPGFNKDIYTYNLGGCIISLGTKEAFFKTTMYHIHMGLRLSIAVFLLPSVYSVIEMDKETTDFAWINYKTYFNKEYDANKDSQRKAAFLESLKYVIVRNLAHAIAHETYQAGLNGVSDFTRLEMKCYNNKDLSANTTEMKTEATSDVFLGECKCGTKSCKDTIDWVAAKRVFKVGLQGCGDCYAWAATYALSSAAAIKMGSPPPDLSVQESKDCSYKIGKYGNFGCVSGRPEVVYMGLIRQTRGNSVNSSSYSPYNIKGGDLTCKKDMTNTANVIVKNYETFEAKKKTVDSTDECTLIQALQAGPVAIQICASEEFQKIVAKDKDFIYDNVDCTKECKDEMPGEKQDINHSVLLVGYTKDAWIIQNSWGKHWGQNGRLQMARGKPGSKRVCNIGIMAQWPKV